LKSKVQKKTFISAHHFIVEANAWTHFEGYFKGNFIKIIKYNNNFFFSNFKVNISKNKFFKNLKKITNYRGLIN
jgi:hypothetical protein